MQQLSKFSKIMVYLNLCTVSRTYLKLFHLKTGQSQQMLVNVIQTKISEKQKSFSNQYLQFRKLFVATDIDNDGLVNEIEMRTILNMLNFQFDEIQNLALFAYLDHDNDG